MHRLNELASRLSAADVKEVEDFAEFLLSRADRRTTPTTSGTPAKGIDVDGLMGLCKGMGGDKSDKELIREAWDAIVAKYD